jgi:predicted ATPase
MIRLVEALNYRCLRYVRQPLAHFHVLVGPNASGKTTFLDVAGFLGDLLKNGLEQAIGERSSSIEDLFFLNQGSRFELALELEVPEELRKLVTNRAYYYIRYEIAIGKAESGEYHIFDEQVLLQEKASSPTRTHAPTLFPDPEPPPQTIMHKRFVRSSGLKRSVSKTYGKNDNFYSEKEIRKGKAGWAPSIRLGPRKSALAGMPEDEEKFPISTWLRAMLMDGTQKLMLDSSALRKSSSPGQKLLFNPQGSNLPWIVADLKKSNPERFQKWIKHVRNALGDIKDLETVELPDTRHRFLNIIYDSGLKVPSWAASDGTLRMLALTLPAFLPDFRGIYLIEEPENGIHPMAMETVFQALRTVYGAQILLATHSPVILGCAEPDQILCFKKDKAGATDIVLGSKHPALQQWKGGVSLATLYASGVLG